VTSTPGERGAEREGDHQTDDREHAERLRAQADPRRCSRRRHEADGSLCRSAGRLGERDRVPVRVGHLRVADAVRVGLDRLVLDALCREPLQDLSISRPTLRDDKRVPFLFKKSAGSVAATACTVDNAAGAQMMPLDPECSRTYRVSFSPKSGLTPTMIAPSEASAIKTAIVAG
jgi:hypothetical protein